LSGQQPLGALRFWQCPRHRIARRFKELRVLVANGLCHIGQVDNTETGVVLYELGGLLVGRMNIRQLTRIVPADACDVCHAALQSLQPMAQYALDALSATRAIPRSAG